MADQYQVCKKGALFAMFFAELLENGKTIGGGVSVDSKGSGW